jgi:hypothetical protein
MQVRRILPTLFLAASASLHAQWQSLGNLDSYQVEGNTIILASGPSAVQITVLAQDVIRVRLAPIRTFGPDFSWAVVKTDWPSMRPEVIDGADDLRIVTSELALVMKKPLTMYSAKRPAASTGNITT